MGIFGKLTKPGADGMSLLDRAAIFATAAEGNTEGAMAYRGSIADRMKRQQQQQFMAQLAGRLGPQYAPTNNELTVGLDGEGNASTWSPEASINPVRTSNGLDINSPELPALALDAQRLGVDMKTLLDVMKAQQPDVAIGPDGTPYNKRSMAGLPTRFRNPTNVNGWVADLNNPTNEGQYFPDLGRGIIPDGKGGVANIGGLTPALQAQTEAETLGRTRGTMLNVPRPNGGTGLMTGAQFLGTPEQPGAQGQGFGLSQAPDDAEYAGVLAKNDAARFEGIVKGGESARAMEGNLVRMSTLLDGLNTGRLTPTGRDLASLATSFGIEVDPSWGNIEAAEAIANKLALDYMGGSLGAGFSNADRDFVRTLTPQVTQTPQGRKLLIDFGIKKAQRDQEIARKARAWQQRAGRLDRPDASGQNFYDYLDVWAEQNPLVPQRR